MPKTKMYILICNDISNGFAIVTAAHASLACYLKFKDHPDVAQWLDPGPFYKVICSVSREEFNKAKDFDDYVVLTESSLNNQEVAITFRPRENWPKWFKNLSLWK